MTDNAPTRIMLCADDYGQSAAVSAGILQLVAMRRLSAISCMTEGPFWNSADNPLQGERPAVDIGLHFNLTHAFPGQRYPARPLKDILRAALLGTLDNAALDAALHAQLDRFEAVLGQAPDFVDGHQHVHIFPQIRSRLLAVLANRYPGAKPWLRAVDPRLDLRNGALKLAFLKMLATGFRAAARRRGFALNARFAGIYSLQPQADFPALMRYWLAHAQPGELIMCHPGREDRSRDDEIAATRPRELAFLGSAEFGDMLAREHIELVRHSALAR